MGDQEMNSPAAEPRRHALFAMLGLLLILAGPFVYYFFFLEYPFLRSTGLPALVMAIGGLALTIWAFCRDRRRRIRLFGFINGALFVFVLLGFFVLTGLPPATAPALAQQAPDFAIPDHEGREFSLTQALDAGPVLLIFYRGDW
jgi:hypothetical protein